MANEQKPNPTTGQENDISKSQAQQQPAAQATQQPEKGEQRGEQLGQAGQFETSQQSQQAEFAQGKSAASPELGQQGDTLAQQRTDVEGASLGSEENEEPESGFVGSKGERDTSGLIEDEDFEKDGQGAPEGK
jgi:hypothetical protein